MIDEQQIAAPATAPAQRAWAVWLAAAGVLAVLVAGLWLFTPHLVSDQVQEVVGEVPQGATITLPSGADADPSGGSGWVETYLGVTNTGLLPVTLALKPSFGEISGTAGVQSADLGLARSRSTSGQFADEVTLEPGEQAFVFIRVYSEECSDSGASESLTTVRDVILRAQVGPFERDARVSAWVTVQVVTEDGSALPPCP